MPAPNRPSILISAALAVATPLLAGAHGLAPWTMRPHRRGLRAAVLAQPAARRVAGRGPPRRFQLSALPTVLLYFGGYLLLCHGGECCGA